MTTTKYVHVRQLASNRVHLLDISDHTTYLWRDDDSSEFRHDLENYETPSYRCVVRPARVLCGAKLGSQYAQVVIMRGWDPTMVCRTCRRLAG